MAQPIPLKIEPRDPKQELLTRLEQAPEEYAAALLDSYELLQELHEKGVFTIVRGVLGASQKLVETASAAGNSPEAIRVMRNAIILGKMLGSIDPEFLQGTANAVSKTFGDAKSLSNEPPSLFSLATGFLGRDLRRVMALLNTFLKNLAYQLKVRTAPDRNH